MWYLEMGMIHNIFPTNIVKNVEIARIFDMMQLTNCRASDIIKV